MLETISVLLLFQFFLRCDATARGSVHGKSLSTILHSVRTTKHIVELCRLLVELFEFSHTKQSVEIQTGSFSTGVFNTGGY